MLDSTPGSGTDPLVDRVRAWIATRDAADALMREWQGLETELFRMHGAMSPREASRRGYAEGDQMRLLDIRYTVLSRALSREAGLLAEAAAVSVAGAIAKIEMGLRIQQPLDSEDCAWALVHGGFTELQSFVRDHPRAGSAAFE